MSGWLVIIILALLAALAAYLRARGGAGRHTAAVTATDGGAQGTLHQAPARQAGPAMAPTSSGAHQDTPRTYAVEPHDDAAPPGHRGKPAAPALPVDVAPTMVMAPVSTVTPHDGERTTVMAPVAEAAADDEPDPVMSDPVMSDPVFSVPDTVDTAGWDAAPGSGEDAATGFVDEEHPLERADVDSAAAHAAPAPDAAPAAESTEAAATGDWSAPTPASDDAAVPDAAVPDAAGSGPKGWAVKGNLDSMLFHTPDSPKYTRMRADVWFESEAAAEAAGFLRWDAHRR